MGKRARNGSYSFDLRYNTRLYKVRFTIDQSLLSFQKTVKVRDSKFGLALVVESSTSVSI